VKGPLELEIERLAAGGDGVGHAPDGRVVFVPDVAPGDRVRVRLVSERARFAHARVEALLEPGPSRTDPLCPVFGSCGGCAWQQVAYPAQLEAKAAILADALRRLGGLSLPALPPVVPSPAPYAYRGRARVLAAGGRVGFRRRRSHAVCATRRCPILVPDLDAALARLADHPPRSDGEWELVAGAKGRVRALPLGRERGEALEIELSGDRLRVSPGVFVQSNALLLGELAEAVHQAAGSGERAFELYAGAGFFTLGLARRFARVVAVEGSRAAAADLRHNLRAAALPGVEVVECAVERALAAPGRLPERADAAVLDPPRRGLPPGGADALARLAPARLAMLSCDPATLARDLAALVARGYRLGALRGFDLFPQTPHVEALAVLERDG
jgi:23S rRNA (uracil1939-C5)-methyltransferase